MARLFSLLALVGIVGVAFFAPPYGPRPAYAIDCDTYPYQQLAQLILRLQPEDPNELDGPDDNGIACEDRPCPCDTDPVEEAIGDESGPNEASSSSDEASAGASAGDTSASASASTNSAAATPTSTSASIVVAPGVITPPSTGGAGLR